MAVLEFLSAYYVNTLRTFVWVDSLNNSKQSWAFMTSRFDNSPDPLIMMSWLCKNLEELVMYGYKYYEENLIAIARLRGDKLKKLEIAEEDILTANYEHRARESILNVSRIFFLVLRAVSNCFLCVGYSVAPENVLDACENFGSPSSHL